MKTLFVVFTLLAASLNSLQSFAQAQEICNNGLDDDGDGFVDCFDRDCANFSSCQGGYVGNDLVCEATPSEFPKFSLALKSASLNGTANHLGRPVVGDIDGDGIPEMITINRYSKKIFILNGENVNGVNTVQRELATSYSPAFEDIAIANLNNGNGSCAEIFVLSTGWRLYAYDCNLTELWSRQLPGDPGTIGIADFNGDGVEEIYARNAIYNAQTGAEIIAPGASWSSFNGGPVAVDIIGDARLELVCGGIIYNVDIVAKTLTPHAQSIANYGKRVNIDATSVADYNQDGHLDIIATGRNTTNGNTTVFFWDVQNNVVKTFSDPIPGNFTIYACPARTSNYYEKGWHQGTGRVNIADLDGDGRLNAAFVSGKYLYALKEDFTLLWRKVVNEETSGNTGCTLFDFNGDGKAEVVYRDEKNIYIIDGTNGSTFTSQTCVSRTNREYPIVALSLIHI